MIAPGLPGWAAEFLLTGVDSTFVSRHSRGYATAKAMSELGVPAATALDLLWQGCLKCRPQLLDQDWTLRTIRRIYGQEAV